ncbi:hypothetical protein N752_30995 [Desulforamulus aquiferis]|nr:aldehyde ferredoxin oxidoreductase N-terminal domain-containing protein [Desulforamulus aquiferis]RYD01424.1 hypothetical protein N752_30995 [Desulforamulus aquiferis]
MSKVMGLTGVMLRVNLTKGTAEREETPKELFARYFGGRGVGAALLIKELPAILSPLDRITS